MPGRVILEIVEGSQAGKRFVFAKRTVCVLGRARDCQPRIVDRPEPRVVSRHHCLLDINPPDIRVRDFGSLNGTLLNGQKIGQRDRLKTAEEGACQKQCEHDLKNGDQIKLGNTVIRVAIAAPEIAERTPVEGFEMSDDMGEIFAEAVDSKPPQDQPAKTPLVRANAGKLALCAKCGRNVSVDVGGLRTGDFLCAACRADPLDLAKMLLHEATTATPPLRAVGRYELIRELGQGGMGAVYLAQHPKTNRRLALKLMLPKVAADPRSGRTFLREVQNTKVLRHANVVRLYDAGSSHGAFFIVLEYCDGGNVAELLARRGGTLPVGEAVPLIVQALAGLEYAHQVEVPYVRLEGGGIGWGRGLVHRDLKPQNIFLATSVRGPIVKLGDYGLSKAFDLAGLSGHTCTGEVAGTPHYMPRQQVLHYRDVGPEVDVWALAATLYRMLAGRAPRDFRPGTDVWQTVLQEDAVPIRKRDPSIPHKLAEVIDHALRERPQIGFRTAADFKEALLGSLG